MSHEAGETLTSEIVERSLSEVISMRQPY